MKKLSYQAPFKPDGSVPFYAGSWEEPIEWLEVEPFAAVLRLESMDKGSHGATRYIWRNVETGAKYHMFTVDMLDLVQNHTITAGIKDANWIVQKRGANYGVRLYDEDSN